MLHQHGGGDSTNTAGNGGDGLNNGLDLVEDAVAGHTALALGGDLLGIPVHRNIDDDLAFADKVLGQAVQNAGSGDDDVSIAADLSGVDGAGVLPLCLGISAWQAHPPPAFGPNHCLAPRRPG